MIDSGLNIFRKKLKKLIGKKNITTNIFKVQAYDSIMCGNFCIWFIDFMLKGKSLLEDANLFSPIEYGKNDKVILKIFKKKLKWKKCFVLFVVNIWNKSQNMIHFRRNISPFYHLH